MRKAFILFTLTKYYAWRTRKHRAYMQELLSLGGNKDKMLSFIRKLHRENDGSYKSSNSIITFNILKAVVKIQHKHGYIIMSFKSESGIGWKYYLTEPYDIAFVTTEDIQREILFVLNKKSKPKKYMDDYWEDLW